jgi:hypothetical protein
MNKEDIVEGEEYIFGRSGNYIVGRVRKIVGAHVWVRFREKYNLPKTYRVPFELMKPKEDIPKTLITPGFLEKYKVKW